VNNLIKTKEKGVKTKKNVFVLLFFSFICLVGILTIEAYESKNVNINKVNTIKQEKVNNLELVKSFGKLPLYFVENKGQFNKKILFYTKTRGYTLWITKEGLVFDSIIREKTDKKEKWKDKTPEFKIKGRDISTLRFLNQKKDFKIIPLNKAKYKVNYYIGNDKTKWINNIKTSKGILLKGIYKNIDLKIYGTEKLIEYDWIVKKGGNPEDIEIEYENVEKTGIDKKGNIIVQMKFGKIMHKKPVSYQLDNIGKKEYVKSEFVKTGKNRYKIKVKNYNKTRKLIIDPVVLIYSTYLGGSGNDYGYGIAVDSRGCAYMTGCTDSGDFPTQNPYQTHKTAYDVFVTKLSADGQSLIYSTYLGGNDDDSGEGITIDSSGCSYITGYTDSIDFPIQNQYQTNQADRDIFVTKLSANGGLLIYSTYLGGSGNDYGYGIAVDGSGCAYITGYTYSSDFPTENPYQTDQTNIDAFVTKLSANGDSLIYSTYLGGSGVEEGDAISIDKDGYAYVLGTTNSDDFPTVPHYSGSIKGILDVFITKVSKDGSSLIFSGYFGGNDIDFGCDVNIDESGYINIVGYTSSTDFPVQNAIQNSNNGKTDVFVIKMTSDANSLVYSTYLGGNDDDHGYGITVDSSGCAYITGDTYSTDFPTKYSYQTDQPGGDVFVTKLSFDGQSFIYSTYLGGNSDDWGKGIAVDSNDYAYITGHTSSGNFPTQNPYQTNQPGHDAFVTKLALSWTVSASVSGGHGSVSPESQTVDYGQTATINIIPDLNYEIESITDNGVSKPISNPYKIEQVKENHDIFVKFKSMISVVLSGERKTEVAWIIRKEYGKLDIMISNRSGTEYTLVIQRGVKGSRYSDIKSMKSSEISEAKYIYYDKYLEKGVTYGYRVIIKDSSGNVIAYSNTINL